MDAAEFRKLLVRLEACSEARRWADGRSLQETWDVCDRADWLLWLAGRMADKPGWHTSEGDMNSYAYNEDRMMEGIAKYRHEIVRETQPNRGENLRARKEVMAVVARVASAHGITTGELLSRDKYAPVVKARAEAARVLREELKLSYPSIGAVLNQHPSTVMYHLGAL
jgi:hypothetical protein